MKKKAIEAQEEKTKCEWFDRHSELCRNWSIDGDAYCNFHQYVNEYSDEMKENSEYCPGCTSYRYRVGGCVNCRELNKIHRDKVKEAKKDDPKCPAITDNNICGHNVLDNGYCGKHKKHAIKDKIIEDGTKKICSNFNKRKCVGSLDINSEYSKCDKCREADRKKDHNRRAK